MTIKEIEKLLRIGQVTAYNLLREPDFPAIKVGHSYRIPRDEFIRWIYSRLPPPSFPNIMLEEFEDDESSRRDSEVIQQSME